MSPPKVTRRTAPAPTFSGNCFFCDGSEEIEKLHTVMTLQFDANIRKMAMQLQDNTLLAKLSVGMLIKNILCTFDCYLYS